MRLLNRDLSWLGFNLRVLQEAQENDVPLFERLKFLAIFSSNLDEFFRVRYPEIIALSLLKKKTKKAIDYYDANVVQLAQEEIKRQLDLFKNILQNCIVPQLKENGIIFYYNMPVLKEHLPEIREIFLSDILSFIRPIYLDENGGKNFNPQNNQLYFVVTLQKSGEEILKHAIVNIPSEKIKRFFVLRPLADYEYVTFLDDIVRENLQYIFPNQEITGSYSIKINRDSQLDLAEDYTGDILEKIEKQLKKRDFNPPSRFLYEQNMPVKLQKFLASIFNVGPDEMFSGGRYYNLDDLADFPAFNKNFYYRKRKALSSPNIINSGDIFNILLQEDILLHLPYQSYNPVLSFFNQAAVDVNVTEIYITFYRVAEESHIINALISAAKNGKAVTVFIELKARFDEANNIKWSKEMKDVGIKIIYSGPHIKVHTKIAVVKRRGKVKQSFAILSTGNFNETTAQFYTDHLLMTTDATIVKDLLQLFKFLELGNVVTDKTKVKFENLLVSRFNMMPALNKLINQEIAKAKKGKPALIRIKVNNLEEPKIISKLYKASQAGVCIQLLVRSVCCLVPGIAGESENITVKRIVDRYLEHSRILIFGTGTKTKVYIGSADLMTRNLLQRIEVFVGIKNYECKNELIKYFEIQWKDNDKAVLLLAGGDQKRSSQDNVKYNAQAGIYRYLAIKNR